MKALLRAAQDTDLHALWVLMATTGVRVGEALGLRWEDLDLDARTLRVNRTVYTGGSLAYLGLMSVRCSVIAM